jgi:hypothetical protein
LKIAEYMELKRDLNDICSPLVGEVSDELCEEEGEGCVIR